MLGFSKKTTTFHVTKKDLPITLLFLDIIFRLLLFRLLFWNELDAVAEDLLKLMNCE